ncbi:hypothetical protein FEF65_13215 [Mariprofundus erugo]|uniref:ABC-type transport auxiliary lipoprotein component domain-containing protein n=1 Tax=Mariprofundus erugo TaxID=2528639 RepID=A0A5R9GLT4_9PROT|nr:hypothetical protein [Mariprofundus erugo]TLS65257.1 hypothetical protein FEF65_13215 [Mariprofundus erugo]
MKVVGLSATWPVELVIGGRGTLLIQADFFDATGKKLSSVQTDAVISGGLLGGSFESAIDKAVEKLAEYAIANFKG